MSAPVPAPRNVNLVSEGKKPIPKPRTTIPLTRNKSDESSSSSKNSEENGHTNTFSRRVKTASKQIAGDIGDLVHERKKAVIEGTRQSVRKITRRFTTLSQEIQPDDDEKNEDLAIRGNKEEEAINVFSSIQFQSPINQKDNSGIYNNVSLDSDLSVSINNFEGRNFQKSFFLYYSAIISVNIHILNVLKLPNLKFTLFCNTIFLLL